MSSQSQRRQQNPSSYAAAAASGTGESGRYASGNRSSLSAATAAATGLNRDNRRKSADDDPYNFDIGDEDDQAKKSKKKHKKKKPKRQSTSGLEKVKAQLQEKGLGKFGEQKSAVDRSRESNDGLTLEERVQRRLESLSSQREQTLSTLTPEVTSASTTPTEDSTVEAQGNVEADDDANGDAQYASPSYPYSPGSDSFSISESDFQPQTTNKERLRANIMSKWQKSKQASENATGDQPTVLEDEGEDSGSRDTDQHNELSNNREREQRLTDSGMLRAELGMGDGARERVVANASEPMSFSYQGSLSTQISSFKSAIPANQETLQRSTVASQGVTTTTKAEVGGDHDTVESVDGYSVDFDQSDSSGENASNEKTPTQQQRPPEAKLSPQSKTSLRSSQSPPPPPQSSESSTSEVVPTCSIAADVTSKESSTPVSTHFTRPTEETVSHGIPTTGIFSSSKTSSQAEVVVSHTVRSSDSECATQDFSKSQPASTTAVRQATATTKVDAKRAPPPGTGQGGDSKSVNAQPANNKQYQVSAAGSATSTSASAALPQSYNDSRNVANEALFASLQAARLVPPGKIKMDETGGAPWETEMKKGTSSMSNIEEKEADSGTSHSEATIKQYAEEIREKSETIASLQSQIKALETQMGNMGNQIWNDQQMRSENYRYEALLASMREIISGSFEQGDEEKLDHVLVELTDELKVLETLMQGYQKENERLQQRFKSEVNRANALARELDKHGTEDQDQGRNGFSADRQQEESNAEVASRLSRELDSAKREEKLREQMEKLMGEKSSLERKIQTLERQKKDIEGEFQALQQSKIDEESTEIKRLKSEISYLKASNDRTVQALQAKLDWYRENQTLLDSDYNELQRLRKRVRELEATSEEKNTSSEGSKEAQLRKRISHLEKALKTAEESLQKRNPDSVANLVREAQTDSDSPLARQVKQLSDQLESERQAREEEKEESSRQLRSLRQEHDKMTSKLKKKNSELSESLKKAEERLRKYEADPAGKETKKGTKKGSWQQRALDAEAELKKVREFYQNKMKKLQNQSAATSSKTKPKQSTKAHAATAMRQTETQGVASEERPEEANTSEDVALENKTESETESNNECKQTKDVEGSDVHHEAAPADTDSPPHDSEEATLASFKRYVVENSNDERSINALTQQLNSLSEKCNRLEQEKDNYQQQVNDLQSQLSSIKGENGFLRRQNDSLLQRVEASSSNSSKDNLRRAVADLEAKLEEREKRLANAEGGLRQEAAAEVERVKREYNSSLETRTQQLRDLEVQFRRLQSYVLKLAGSKGSEVSKDADANEFKEESGYSVDDILASYSGVI